MKNTITHCWVALLLFLPLVNPSIVNADDPQATIEALATSDLLAVAYVDLNSIDIAACLQWAEQHKIITPEMVAELDSESGIAQELLRQTTNAGADHVIALIEQEDLKFQGPPLLVFSVAEGKEAKETINSLQLVLNLLRIQNFELEIWNGCILGGTAKQIERAKASQPIERPNLTKAWQTFGGHGAGAMIVANGDTRRVIRELMPDLDSPFENVTGELIADNLTSIGFSIDLPKDVGARIIVQTTDKQSANIVNDALVDLKKLLVANKDEYLANAAKGEAVILGVLTSSAFPPKAVDNDVVLDLEALLNDQALKALFKPILNSRSATQRVDNIRMIALAMLNYESANGSFPAYANFDPDGKPLLSWRVHILPFLEQNNLYQQFKLDEPWDSPHNIKLAAMIPEVYDDLSVKPIPGSELKRTRFVVPFGDGMMFHGAEKVTFAKIIDGTTNTILVANVPASQAVVWTQPVDWNVDLKNPKEGIFDDENQKAIVAKADGSAATIVAEISAEELKTLLTKDAGDIPQG